MNHMEKPITRRWKPPALLLQPQPVAFAKSPRAMQPNPASSKPTARAGQCGAPLFWTVGTGHLDTWSPPETLLAYSADLPTPCVDQWPCAASLRPVRCRYSDCRMGASSHSDVWHSVWARIQTQQSSPCRGDAVHVVGRGGVDEQNSKSTKDDSSIVSLYSHGSANDFFLMTSADQRTALRTGS